MTITGAIILGLASMAAWFGSLAGAWWLFSRAEERRVQADLARWRRVRRCVP